MATKSEMRDRLLHLLTGPEAGAINFTFEWINFTGSIFGLVALAIYHREMDGRTGIGFTDVGTQNGISASYNPIPNTFEVSSFAYGATDYEENGLIHESVHAWHDIVSGTPYGATKKTPKLKEEALAFLVAAVVTLKRRAKGAQALCPAVPTKAEWPKMPDSDVEAFKIVALIYNNPNKIVTPNEAKPLLDKVNQEYTKAIKGWDPSKPYGHNGV
jgi:hypothetical protein